MNKILRVMGQRGRITIPWEIRLRLGIRQNDILSFSDTQDGKSVIVTRESLCDGCTDTQEDGMNEESLVELLECLSENQKKIVLRHLTNDVTRMRGVRRG